MKISPLNLIFTFGIVISCSKGFAGTDQREIIKEKSGVCWSGNVEIQGEVDMKNGCVATGGVLIRSSNAKLNCNGGVIELGGAIGTGVEIDSMGKPLSNIAVKNCVIKNSKFKAIYIGWNASDREKSEKVTRDIQYLLTPKNINITNTKILNPGSSGIYIDDYVQNVVMDNIEILNSPAMAIYFEFSSKNSILRNSKISGAGKLVKREAISIDSSAGNIIENNIFIDNPYGGIFVYKNCGENLYVDKKQVKRWMQSSKNKIINNVIDGSRVGIWMASRQSQKLHNVNCGNGYYAEGKYSLDDVQDNLIENNKIRKSDIGIIIEDDNNQVIGNEFFDVLKMGIRIGTPIRSKYLNKPVVNTKISGNKSYSPTPLLNYMWGSDENNNR